ncbi:tyrosyl-tRNA synthetase, variant [Thecamonas trahens ATCC 50062]|nr:tyrosyl-tRNA synthetase, variant [Thecamonas trahens ATCC 50062]KNC49520.1 tyrosyl-tRNA synthetase, variant [Thecamonas trahens ATCC 50062]|eukprot:XP_013757637.1 tyrosyl-tRNA synthetase, variant [Thecamonas trahens ATCC 50062]
MLRRFAAVGVKPVVLLGGATGLLGDPSGKTAERTLMPVDELARNMASIEASLRMQLLDGRMEVRNNAEWMAEMGALELLREYGKHFRVSAMLARDAVASRLESGTGISFTEFAYQMVQGIDFAHLYESDAVAVQIGGSDQWGNITAGLDLIRRRRSGDGTPHERPDAVGVTYPLLTTADGAKLGKSAGNAVWLDARLTSPFDLYQYFALAPDADVRTLLCALTELSLDTIEDELAAHFAQPSERRAQKTLAAEVTRMVHGTGAAGEAARASDALYARDGEAAPASAYPRHELAPGAPLDGASVVALAAAAGLAPSKSAAKRLANEGGLYLNGERVASKDAVVSASDISELGGVVIKAGKRKVVLVVEAES